MGDEKEKEEDLLKIKKNEDIWASKGQKKWVKKVSKRQIRVIEDKKRIIRQEKFSIAKKREIYDGGKYYEDIIDHLTDVNVSYDILNNNPEVLHQLRIDFHKTKTTEEKENVYEIDGKRWAQNKSKNVVLDMKDIEGRVIESYKEKLALYLQDILFSTVNFETLPTEVDGENEKKRSVFEKLTIHLMSVNRCLKLVKVIKNTLKDQRKLDKK